MIRHGIAFSPDGKHLASGGSGDESIYVRNVESGSLATKPFIGNKGGVYSVSYSPDGRKIDSGSADKTVRSWNASNGDPLSTFDVHPGHVYSITHSNDGLYAVSGYKDKTIRV